MTENRDLVRVARAATAGQRKFHWFDADNNLQSGTFSEMQRSLAARGIKARIDGDGVVWIGPEE